MRGAGERGLVLPPDGAPRSGNLDNAKDLWNVERRHLTGPPKIPSLFSLSMSKSKSTKYVRRVTRPAFSVIFPSLVSCRKTENDGREGLTSVHYIDFFLCMHSRSRHVLLRLRKPIHIRTATVATKAAVAVRIWVLLTEIRSLIGVLTCHCP